jgi:hypothetical protein
MINFEWNVHNQRKSENIHGEWYWNIIGNSYLNIGMNTIEMTLNEWISRTNADGLRRQLVLDALGTECHGRLPSRVQCDNIEGVVRHLAANEWQKVYRCHGRAEVNVIVDLSIEKRLRVRSREWENQTVRESGDGRHAFALQEDAPETSAVENETASKGNTEYASHGWKT